MSLSAFGNLEIIPKQLFVIRMSAVFDDTLGALHRALSTQVGNTLFCYDDIDIMFRVVLMADERYDSTEQAACSYRRAGEDADISVALKVAATANTVHRSCTAYLRRVGREIALSAAGFVFASQSMK